MPSFRILLIFSELISLPTDYHQTYTASLVPRAHPRLPSSGSVWDWYGGNVLQEVEVRQVVGREYLAGELTPSLFILAEFWLCFQSRGCCCWCQCNRSISCRMRSIIRTRSLSPASRLLIAVSFYWQVLIIIDFRLNSFSIYSTLPMQCKLIFLSSSCKSSPDPPSSILLFLLATCRPSFFNLSTCSFRSSFSLPNRLTSPISFMLDSRYSWALAFQYAQYSSPLCRLAPEPLIPLNTSNDLSTESFRTSDFLKLPLSCFQREQHCTFSMVSWLSSKNCPKILGGLVTLLALLVSKAAPGFPARKNFIARSIYFYFKLFSAEPLLESLAWELVRTMWWRGTRGDKHGEGERFLKEGRGGQTVFGLLQVSAIIELLIYGVPRRPSLKRRWEWV